MNKILLKTGHTSQKTRELLDGASPRELVFDASSGFIWIKDSGGNRLRVAGPRATSSFCFKGIVQEALTAYPGAICDVGDALFLQAASTIDGDEIPAGSLIIKVADTADGIGSWYTIDKVSQTTLKVSSALFEATNLIDALEEICAKVLEPDGVNLVEKDGKVCLSKDVSVSTLTVTGDETGPKMETCSRLGTVTPDSSILLLFKKNLQDSRTHLSGEVFEYGQSGMSHTRLSLSSIGAKNFSSVSSSPNGRTRLVTCTYAGFVWFALRFPANQSSAVYFSGWRNVPEDMAPPVGYSDADISNVEVLTADAGEGMAIFDSALKRGVEIDDMFYLKVPVSAGPSGFIGPITGSTYFDSEIGMPMFFQGNRWESSVIQASFGAESADGQYLAMNGIQSGSVGHVVPRAAVIKSISVVSGGGKSTKAFEIRKNGDPTSLYSFSLVNGAFSKTGLSIPVGSLDFVQVFASAVGNKVNNVIAVLELAYTK